MTTLATSDDVAERLGREFTDSEVARVEALLIDASAAVRSYTGQTFDVDETTDRLRVRNNVVRLPQRPVTDVSEVTDPNGNTLTFTWEGGDRVVVNTTYLNAFEINIPRSGVTAVDVTYEHGYETVPADIVAVVCQVAGRALGRASTDAGMTSETIEGYSYSIGAAGAAGPLGLMADEKAVLDRYRREGATARLA